MKILSKGKIEGIIGKNILVCKKTTPKIIEQILKSKAVFVEEGCLLSHSSIICRELNIPCIKIENATKVFKKGMKIVGLNWLYPEVLLEIDNLLEKYKNINFKVNGEPLKEIGATMINGIKKIKMDRNWNQKINKPIKIFKKAKTNSERMIAISWIDKIVRASFF